MSARDLIEDKLTQTQAQPDDMARLLKARPAKRQTAATLPSVIIGELLAIADDGKSPLVIYPGQVGTAALRARSVLDLHGAHIGQSVVLQFEGGDPALPIVMGVIRQVDSQPLEAPGNVRPNRTRPVGARDGADRPVGEYRPVERGVAHLHDGVQIAVEQQFVCAGRKLTQRQEGRQSKQGV